MNRFRGAVATTATLLLAGACGASGADPVERSAAVTSRPIAPPETTIEATTTTELDDGWIPDPHGGTDGPVAYQAGGPNGEEAEVGGILVLDDGCLYLDTGLARRSAVLWPNGTRWDPATRSVVMIDGVQAPLGSRLVGGGGYGDLSEPDAAHPDRGREALVENCSPAASVAVVGFLQVIDPSDIDNADRDLVLPTIPDSVSGLGLPVARSVSTVGLSYGCITGVTYEEPPTNLERYERAPDEIVEAIDRIAGWGDVFVNDVSEWAIIDRGSVPDEVMAFGIVQPDEPNERTRYAFVTLEPAQAGGYRYTQWGECFMSAQVRGYSQIDASEFRVDGDTGALIVTGEERGCPRDEDDPVDIISIVRITDSGPAVALFAATQPSGYYEMCEGSPLREYAVVVDPDLDPSTLLDGHMAPPHPVGQRPEPAMSGMTLAILDADPAVNGLLRSLSQNSPNGGVISHGEFLLDAAPGEAGVIVFHTPGNRDAARDVVEQALGSDPIPIVYEEQAWTLDAARRFSNRLAPLLDPERSSLTSGVDGVGIVAVDGAWTQDELESIVNEVERIKEDTPALAHVPVAIDEWNR